MDPLISAWMLTSTAVVGALLVLACVALGNERWVTARVLGCLLVAAIWAHPLAQKWLATGPTLRLADELEAYVGQPLERTVAEFGEPRRERFGGFVFTAAPWYAPWAVFQPPEVHVLSFDRESVGHVYFDD